MPQVVLELPHRAAPLHPFHTDRQHVRQVVLGMPHRGRLNVLCTLLGKPAGALFQEMDNAQSRFHVGDVKYHLGQTSLLSFPQQVCSTQCCSHVPVMKPGSTAAL